MEDLQSTVAIARGSRDDAKAEKIRDVIERLPLPLHFLIDAADVLMATGEAKIPQSSCLKSMSENSTDIREKPLVDATLSFEERGNELVVLGMPSFEEAVFEEVAHLPESEAICQRDPEDRNFLIWKMRT